VVWAETRSPYLQDAFLPDFSRRDVLPHEASGQGTYSQIAERVKQLHKQDFTCTPRNEWRHEKGPIFEKLMTGKLGRAIQRLDFGIGDLLNDMLQPQDQTPGALAVSVDIDSGMGWLPSLGAIKGDLTLYPYPLSSRNFEAPVHHFLDWRLGNEDETEMIPIHEIHHFLLGTFGLVGKSRIQLYLFLPNLRQKRRKPKTNTVLDSIKDKFISRCLLPAIRKELTDFQMEQYPHGMWEAKMDSEAPKHEGQLYSSTGNALINDVVIPEQYLSQIWNRCKRRMNRGSTGGDWEMEALKDSRLFWCFKGEKYSLCTSNVLRIEEPEEKVSCQSPTKVIHLLTPL